MTIEWLSRPLAIGRKKAPNRVVYQPTEANNCDAEGSPTAHTVKKYLDIARGGPGIISIESIDVTLKTQARSNRMLILDRNLPGLEKLVAEIRKANRESLVVFQLSHAGRLSDPAFKPPMYVYAPGGAAVPVMSTADVEEAREEFVAAAKRAWKVGADGVDFKQAHAFLGDDFLHPANRRSDRYGGSWENRTRFFRETMARLREEIPDRGFLVGSRISPYEAVPGAFGTSGPEEILEDLAEPVAFAKLMEKEGIDFINVSGGSAAGNLELLMPTAAYPEGVFRHFSWTRAIKKSVSIPVIGSGYSRPQERRRCPARGRQGAVDPAVLGGEEPPGRERGPGRHRPAGHRGPRVRAQGGGGQDRRDQVVHHLRGVHAAARRQQACRLHRLRQGVQGPALGLSRAASAAGGVILVDEATERARLRTLPKTRIHVRHRIEPRRARSTCGTCW